MGDKETLARARKELEELYLGVPDDSVNLTFQDFAQVRQLQNAENKKPSSPSSTSKNSQNSPSTLTKLPSLDFSRGLQASFQSSNHHHNLHHNRDQGAGFRASGGHILYNGHDHHHASHQYHHGHGSLHNGDQQRRMVYDDMSYVSGVSATVAYGREGGGARRRPGIPHSNICTVCCNYIYVFRHRCLVCGRAYCRQCVSVGMGEMTEGRKCIDCLGRRFSQRYIQKAGNIGCCMGYSSTVKQQELKWAEKGPRRSGENRYGHSVMVSRSRSPAMATPSTPTLRAPHSPTNPPSFVASSPYSPYTPTTHHPLPF